MTHVQKTVVTLGLAWLALTCQWGSNAAAEMPHAPAIRLPVAQLQADPAIPTIEETLGYDWAASITSHAAMERYLHALAEAAPDRVRLVRYGESYEQRGLYYLAITSPGNFRQLDTLRQSILRLSDPRQTPLAEAAEIIAKTPAVVWLASSVHGNELSSTEAAMLTCYHLLADRRAETKKMLENLIVLIDPLQNPDGRERFVNVFRETRGRFINSYPLSTEHTERWPGGRFNHYLFDMNRDWFLQSQQETVFKVKAYLDWQPQIYVDSHEMGRNSTYFFVPPTDPVNPFMLAKQRQWLHSLGENQAGWFDRYGFAYTTREIFDAFYPGYGSEWPTLQGGLGILWEQAGVRGLVIDRDDETQLAYHDAVSHHYVSSLATVQLASQQRERLLTDFYDARSRGMQLGNEGDVRHFVLPLTPRPARTLRLAQLLQRNGIDVMVMPKSRELTATDVQTGAKSKSRVAAGSLYVPVAQPTGRLVRVLLDRSVDMDDEYIQQQLERKDDYLPDQIYDVTAWSLPLAFDVPCLATSASFEAGSAWDGRPTMPHKAPPEAKVAYVVPPTDDAIEALSQWLQQGVRVHVTNKSLTLNDREFPPGTLIVKRHENGKSLHRTMAAAVEKYDLDVTAADTGFVTKGAHFGGPHVKWVRPPKILLAIDSPARYSVGHTWHLFDQRLGYPTTRVSFENLPRVDLGDFNVVVLPHGSYADSRLLTSSLSERLELWVREGGTLILVGGAAVWGADEKIGLVDLQRVAKPEQDDAGSQQDAKETARQRWPDSVPGAFIKGSLFDQHWLTFGCGESINVFVQGNTFFEPVDPERGRSVLQLNEGEDIVASGFCWPDTRKLIAGKTYLAYFSRGDGHIIAFAGDPNYRAMFPNLQRLFLNACLFGPGE